MNFFYKYQYFVFATNEGEGAIEMLFILVKFKTISDWRDQVAL